ncbi:MAG: energy-coupling factor transporter ATPase [Oscillospiraceae bacterium]|jgi:energy-coupling factor transport system ATP-binding protein|nr:energy-coupling factor transporter ATPase [Oscillospiraceae bacterium]
MPILEIRNVLYRYPGTEGENSLPAVDGVSLCVGEGEFVAILGANGSGKSTLAKLMNGILLPESGKILAHGFDTADEEHLNDIRRSIGLVFQNPDNQIVSTIAEEDCAFGPENLGVPPEEIRRRVDWALKAVGLYEQRMREPHKLSGGQKQRLAIAGVLAMRPRLLVLDEPTAMLDPGGRQEVLNTLQALRKEHGMAVIIITHYMNEAAAAERVVVMEHGKITLEGTPQEVFARRTEVESAGLRLPQSAELSLLLRGSVPEFPLCLTPDECAREIIAAAPGIAYNAPALPPSAPAKNEIVLKTQQLTHRYAQNSKETAAAAISGVDLDIYQGECLGIIGHTGSGKSTLIQHFNALLQPSSGSVLLNGADINESKKSRRAARFAAGLCFQYPESQLFAETVREDIAFGPANLGLERGEIAVRVNKAAELVGLSPELLEKSPFDLSGGEKRRAALAGVMAMEPQVLVLDEPAAGLDPKGKLNLRKTLLRYRKETGCTVVLVSHAMEEIAALCDRVLVLDHGEAVMLGTVDEVYSQGGKLAEMQLELPEITRIFALLQAEGFDVPAPVYTPEQAATILAPIQKAGRDGA